MKVRSDYRPHDGGQIASPIYRVSYWTQPLPDPDGYVQGTEGRHEQIREAVNVVEVIDHAVSSARAGEVVAVYLEVGELSLPHLLFGRDLTRNEGGIPVTAST